MDCIRGQNKRDMGHIKRKETSIFDGDHSILCYLQNNGVVVVRFMIDVCIAELES